MSNDLIVLASLAIEINALDNQANYHAVQAVIYAAKCGEKLLLAKAQCKHGQWGQWLADNCKVSQSTANKYMAVSMQFPDLLNSNSESIPNLKTEQAIALLNAPEEVKTEVLERIESGENVSVKAIQALKNKLSTEIQRANLLEQKNLELHGEISQVKDDAVTTKQSAKQSVERAQMAADNAEGNYKELEKRFDHYVTQGVEEKLPAFQQQIETQLAAEYQAKIDSQTDEISRLKNQLTNTQSTPAEIAKINDELRVAQEKLDLASNQITAINKQIAEKRSAIQTDEQINQTYFTCAEQLISGVSASVVGMDVFVDFDDSAQQTVWRSLCVIDDKTKRKLERAIETLQSAAKSLQDMIDSDPI